MLAQLNAMASLKNDVGHSIGQRLDYPNCRIANILNNQKKVMARRSKLPGVFSPR